MLQNRSRPLQLGFTAKKEIMSESKLLCAIFDRLQIEGYIQCTDCGDRQAVYEVSIWREGQNPEVDEPKAEHVCQVCAVLVMLDNCEATEIEFKKSGEHITVGGLIYHGPNDVRVQ